MDPKYLSVSPSVSESILSSSSNKSETLSDIQIHFSKFKHVLKELDVSRDVNTAGDLIRVMRQCVDHKFSPSKTLSNIGIESNSPEVFESAYAFICDAEPVAAALRIDESFNTNATLHNTFMGSINTFEKLGKPYCDEVKSSANFFRGSIRELDSYDSFINTSSDFFISTTSAFDLQKFEAVASSNEILSLLVFEHRICLIVSLNVFVGHIYYLYSQGNFLLYLSDLSSSVLRKFTPIKPFIALSVNTRTQYLKSLYTAHYPTVRLGFLSGGLMGSILLAKSGNLGYLQNWSLSNLDPFKQWRLEPNAITNAANESGNVLSKIAFSLGSRQVKLVLGFSLGFCPSILIYLKVWLIH